eukprot:COSAG06_NODE_4280_length_4405_cov_9.242685_7_plen_28_part_01
MYARTYARERGRRAGWSDRATRARRPGE